MLSQITVSQFFFKGIPFFLIIYYILYITYYITISYKKKKNDFSMWWVSIFSNWDLRLRLFTLFLYQALQRIIQFKVHSEGISLEAETLTGLHRFEVRPQAAVAAAGNGEVPSVEHTRIALARLLRYCLDERVVSIAAQEFIDIGIRVATQNALIVHTGLHTPRLLEENRPLWFPLFSYMISLVHLQFL